jgi:hypothetical protein
MPDLPGCCAVCGSNPVDLEGNQQQALWAEGVDIDWGNNLYLCWECVDIIADLGGRATKVGFDELQAKYDALLEAHAELEKEHEELQETVEVIKAGAAARRRLKATSAS